MRLGPILGVLLVVISLFDFSQVEGAVVGIDLGTEWFKGVLVKPGVPMEIVLNRETKRKTASVVALHDNQRFFGEDALSLSTKMPKDTFFDLLGLLGRQYDDEVAVKYRSRYPNKMVAVPDRGTVAFEISSGEIYSVEELMGMILAHAREQAEYMAGETVLNAVITVPPFFDQTERQALLDAAEIGGLRVLSLMNVDTAAALNFGMAKKFDSKQRHIFYDIGAGNTKVSLVSFGTYLLKEKIKGTSKTKQVNTTIFEVEAVAFDRELSGREFDFRLQQELANRFQKQKGVTSKVHSNPRAMAKILKEAQRVKKVLSANQDTIARIESVLDDVDLYQPITRQEFETLCQDLFERVQQPLKQLLEQTELDLSEIDSITLVGGGTRIPKIQTQLKELVGKELGQNLNTDEAAVFGAAFRAAGLSKLFKVKDIRIKDIEPYPISIAYQGAVTEESEEAPSEKTETDEEPQEKGLRKMTLFKSRSNYGVSKRVTLKRNEFEISYDDQKLDLWSGHGRICKVTLSGTESVRYQDTLKKLAEGDQPKISVQITLDDSGILQFENAEASFKYLEKQEKEEKPESKKEKSFYEKLSSYFSSDEKEEREGTEGAEEGDEHAGESEQPQQSDQEEQQKQEQEEKPEYSQQQKSSEEGEKSDDKKESEKSEDKGSEERTAEQKETEGGDAASGAEKEGKEEEEQAPKKEKVIVEVEKTTKVKLVVHPVFDKRPLTSDEISAAIKRMKKMIEYEISLKKREEAFNTLEAYVYAKQEFLQNDDVVKVSTAEEREKFSEGLSTCSEWIYGDGMEAGTPELVERLSALKTLEKPIAVRYHEDKNRPAEVAKLRKLVDLALEFVKNATAVPEDQRGQTNEDLEKIAEMAEELASWLEEKEKEQEKLQPYEDPVLTVEDIGRKGSPFTKQLTALIQKPKPKPKKAAKEEPKKSKAGEKPKPKIVTEEESEAEEAEGSEKEPSKEDTQQDNFEEQQNEHEQDQQEEGGEGEAEGEEQEKKKGSDSKDRQEL